VPPDPKSAPRYRLVCSDAARPGAEEVPDLQQRQGPTIASSLGDSRPSVAPAERAEIMARLGRIEALLGARVPPWLEAMAPVEVEKPTGDE
jgi:hypothetical protein